MDGGRRSFHNAIGVPIMRAPPSRKFDFEFTNLIAEFTMCNVLLSGELKFLHGRNGFFQTPLFPLRYSGRYNG